jgi:hypothetical protein
MISEEFKELLTKVGQMQVKCNDKQWNMDLESILIALEGHVSTAEWYESQEDGNG